MIKTGIIFLFIFLISNISAVCNENQIDINSASLEELDNLDGIGVVKGQAIIETRPFKTLDDLLNVNGIGDITLKKIKEQGLACVEDEIQNNLPIPDVKEDVLINEEKIIEISTKEVDKIPEMVNLTPISLNAQDIKSENNKEVLKRNLSFYGIIAICVIFGALFLFKNRKRKNEFN